MADTAQRAKTDELAEQIEELRSELSALSDTMNGIVETGRGAASEKAEDFARKGKKAMRAAIKKGKVAVSGVEHTITANPLASVAVAFGVGILLGRLVRR